MRRLILCALGSAMLLATVVLARPAAAVAPPAPTIAGPAARDAGVDLSWAAVAGATTYRLYRGTTAGFSCATPVATVSATSYTDVHLLNRVTYYYKLAAVNAAGEASTCSAQVSAKPVVTPYSWEFNRGENPLEDWGSTAIGIAPPTVTATGRLSLTATTTDPQLYSRDGLGLASADYPQLQVRLANPSPATEARVFWTTDADTTWNAAKSTGFAITPNSGETTYTVTLGATWNAGGRVRQLRLDPQDVGASVGTTTTVDRIAFVRTATAALSAPLTGAIFFGSEGSRTSAQAFDPAVYTDFDYTQAFYGRYDQEGPDQVKLMEQQIDLAADAGIDYFAFTWAGSQDTSQDAAIANFRAAANRSRVKYMIIPIGALDFSTASVAPWVGYGNYPDDKTRWENTEAPWLVDHFKDANYLKIGNRPVLGWFDDTAALATQPNGFGDCVTGSANPGCWYTELQYLKTLTANAGLGPMYWVDTWQNKIAGNYLEAYGFDAVSGYGDDFSSWVTAQTHNSYQAVAAADRKDLDQYSATVRTIPAVTAVYDHRQRNCNRSVYWAGDHWAVSQNTYWADIPTYGQWETNYRYFYDWLQQYPGRSSDPPMMLIYAWNELEEGGQGIVPTVQEGNLFLDAISAVKKGAYPSRYYDWVDDSMLSPAATGNPLVQSGSGITFTGSWTWTQPTGDAAHPQCPGHNAPADPNDPQAVPLPGPPYSHSNDARGFYGNDEHWSSTAGDTAMLAWPGATGFRLLGATGPDRGKLTVSVDGGATTTVDLYAATLQRQQVLFDSPDLAEGTHTIKVTVAGTKNAASTGYKVGVDAIRVRVGRAQIAPPSASGATTEPPARLVASREDSRVDLTWDRVPGAANYIVYRSTSDNFVPNLFNQRAVVADPGGTASRVEYRDAATNGVKYYYKVRNGGGTTDSAEALAVPLAALSRGKTGTASSVSGTHTAAAAVDTDVTSTYWQPVTGNAGEWLQVNLAASPASGVAVNRFYLRESGTRVNGFRIRVSTDYGSTWHDIYTGSGIGGDPNGERSIVIPYTGDGATLGYDYLGPVTTVRLELTGNATGGAPMITAFQTYLR